MKSSIKIDATWIHFCQSHVSFTVPLAALYVQISLMCPWGFTDSISDVKTRSQRHKNKNPGQYNCNHLTGCQQNNKWTTYNMTDSNTWIRLIQEVSANDQSQ